MFVLLATFVISFISCNKAENTNSNNDSVVADTAVVVDSVAADSVVE